MDRRFLIRKKEQEKGKGRKIKKTKSEKGERIDITSEERKRREKNDLKKKCIGKEGIRKLKK